MTTYASFSSVVKGWKETVIVFRAPCDWVDCRMEEALKPATVSGCALPTSFCIATNVITELNPLHWTDIDGDSWPAAGLVTTKENLTVAPAGIVLTT